MATAEPRSNVPAGTVVGEKFRVMRELGRGGMAAVYEAENIHIGKRVAVKVLNAELVTSRIVRERFLREARAAAAIRSPYICDVYDSGMFDGRPFLVMELLEGESLYDHMTRVRRLDPTLTLQVAVHTCRGLSKAHEANVIHRDLKPENIFLTKDENGEMLAKVLDFGLAKFYETNDETDKAQIRLTREGALFGTPAYMSPEQAKGKGDVDHRADLWALGCIVYECLTGQTVWNVDQGVAMILAQIASAPIPKPSKLRPELPPSFDDWFLRALDRDPNKRFQNAKEFADTLVPALRPSGANLLIRRSSVPSDEEGAEVDALVGRSHAAIPGAAGPPVQSLHLEPSEIVTMRPPKKQSSWSAIGALAAVAAAVVGGYALWLYVLNPPKPVAARPPASAAAGADAGLPDAAVVEKLEVMEKEPFALQIGQAQQHLAQGRVENALTMFKEAFDNGGHGVARGLLAHASVALPASDGPCRITGMARPRPFDVVVMSSRPTLGLSPLGPLAVWVDNHQDPARRQAYSAVLDDALRRVSPLRLITPESESVRHPQLLPAGDKLAFIYWEGAGKEPGVYMRMLAADGRIATPARRLSGIGRHEFYPALARAADGTFWAVWEEKADGGVDLFARHLDAEGNPKGEAVRLTAFAASRTETPEVSKPDVALDGANLNAVFALQRGKKQQIMLLHIALSDPALSTGVTPETDDKKKKKKKTDRVAGRMTPVSASHGKNAQPRIACGTEGCFVLWDDERGGALAAFVDTAKGEALWHREFAKKGSRPAVAASAAGVAAAWYEGSRVRVARVNRDGVEKPTSVARVGGYQPYPAIVAGKEPGEWYISWRDYEAGHLEAFVVRTVCQ